MAFANAGGTADIDISVPEYRSCIGIQELYSGTFVISEYEADAGLANGIGPEMALSGPMRDLQ